MCVFDDTKDSVARFIPTYIYIDKYIMVSTTILIDAVLDIEGLAKRYSIHNVMIRQIFRHIFDLLIRMFLSTTYANCIIKIRYL